MCEAIPQAEAAIGATGENMRPAQTRITLRSLLLGFIMAGLTSGMTQVLSIRYQATDVAGDAPPSRNRTGCAPPRPPSE